MQVVISYMLDAIKIRLKRNMNIKYNWFLYHWTTRIHQKNYLKIKKKWKNDVVSEEIVDRYCRIRTTPLREQFRPAPLIPMDKLSLIWNLALIFPLHCIFFSLSLFRRFTIIHLRVRVGTDPAVTRLLKPLFCFIIALI